MMTIDGHSRFKLEMSSCALFKNQNNEHAQHSALCTGIVFSSYEVREASGDEWGALDENGTWRGMIGQVVNRVSHARLHCSQLTTNRPFGHPKFGS